MTPRDYKLAIGLIVTLVLGVGVAGGYVLVLSPLDDAGESISKLNDEIEGLPDKQGLKKTVSDMEEAALKMANIKRQSLPPDLDVAKAQYKLLLERMLHQAKITSFTIPEAKAIPGRPPVTPEIAPKKAAYTALQVRVVIPKANIWQIADFLYSFYQADLLHSITDITIARENKVTETRNGLDVHLTIEALILDGVEKREALFPTFANNKLAPAGEAIAAIGGVRLVPAVAAQSELARKVTANNTTPSLAPSKRDYSLIALKDIFYGVLPPEKSPPTLQIARVPDVKIKEGEPVPDVKVNITGEGAETAHLTATVSGSLLPEGALKVDPKTNTISFPPVNEDAPSYAGSTVSLVAKTEAGKEQKSSFKVSFEASTRPAIDIAAAIRLIMIAGASDEVATAIIFDSANPFKYKITGSKTGIEVAKWYLVKQATGEWRRDRDYEQPAGVLAISDDFSNTKKTFKVIAIEDNGLILADLGKTDAKSDPKGGGKQPGGRQGGNGPPGGGAPGKSGKAEPLAVLAGNMATALPAPTLYRWTNGTSLAEMMDKGKIPGDEAKRIMQRLAHAKGVEIPVSSSK
jgi:hypothetical protein